VTASSDEVATGTSWDPDGAMVDVESASRQWKDAMELSAGVQLPLDGVTSVLVIGIGGSGIAGDVVAAVAAEALPLPVSVHKGFGLPRHVDARTAVMAVSYSGNTEETLDAVDQARRRGARLLAVTSGGALLELAGSAGFPAVAVPGGRQPRHSLGYLCVPLLAALGLADGLGEAVDVLARVTDECKVADSTVQRLGERLADGTVPAVYGTQGPADVAAQRLVCQLGENAKLPAFAATVPELGHNAVMGWEGPSCLVGTAGLIWLRDPAGDEARVAARVDRTNAILAERFSWTETLTSRGVSTIARLASLLQQADLVSLHAAHARQIDPTPIRSIERLQEGL
jgi:glucose/mannose-6-phosphate isomerase